MNTKIDAILIDDKDNVVTAIKALPAGSLASFEKSGQIVTITVTDEIPKFHKIALEDIPVSKHVYKYGQLIGEAVKQIKAGNHVHDHNIRSPQKK
jgi:altronate dehydratase small subunit